MRFVLSLAAAVLLTGFVKADKHDFEAQAALALAKAKVTQPEPVAPVKPATPQPTPGIVRVPNLTGAPLDHTHTCANGHTWDHTMDGGSHRCPFCGLEQWYQDRGMRAVTGGTQSFSSGCANGNCPTATVPQTRGGLFRRLR